MSLPPDPDAPVRPRTRSQSRSRGSASEVENLPIDSQGVAVNPDVPGVAAPEQVNPDAIEVQAEVNVPPNKEEISQDQKTKSILRSTASTPELKKSSKTKKKKKKSKASSSRDTSEDSESESEPRKKKKKKKSKKLSATSESEDTSHDKKKKKKKKKKKYITETSDTEDTDTSYDRKKKKKKKSKKKDEETEDSESSEGEEISWGDKRHFRRILPKKPPTVKEVGTKKKFKKPKRKHRSSSEDSQQELCYLSKDPEYRHLPETGEMQILQILDQLTQATKEALEIGKDPKKAKKWQEKVEKLHRNLPYRIEQFRIGIREEMEEAYQAKLNNSFTGKFYEDMVMRSSKAKDEIILKFDVYVRIGSARKNPKYTYGWDLHHEKGKPDKDVYSGYYNVVKDRYKAGSLLLTDAVPLRNFLIYLREATKEAKLAPSQILAMCTLCLHEKTMRTLRVLRDQGEQQLEKYPGKLRPHPLQYAIRRLSTMLPTKHMIVVDLMEDFWSQDMSLEAFLPNQVNTTIAQLSENALVAYEGRTQDELDEIIKMKVALSVPKEVRQLIFQHEAARLQNGDLMFSEDELYDFLRFIAGRGAKGAFKPDLRRVKKPNPDYENHGIIRSFATTRKIKYTDVKDEAVVCDAKENWNPAPAPTPDIVPSMEQRLAETVLELQRNQEDLLRKQSEIFAPISGVAQKLMDQFQQQQPSTAYIRSPMSVAAVTAVECADESTMLEYAPSDSSIATVNQISREQHASTLSTQQQDDLDKQGKTKGGGKLIHRNDKSWDVYHRQFKEQNTYRDTQGYRRFWDDQVRKVKQTPWWPNVTGNCPKDLQNRYVSEMNRYPRDHPILYKTGEKIMVAKAFILTYADNKVSFCCGRSNCSMITCPATGSSQVLNFCDNCEIGFHSSHSCHLVAKDEADLPRN